MTLQILNTQRTGPIRQRRHPAAWPLDRVAFVKRLDELRGVRNDVMHFNPDPAPADSVEKLCNILGMLRQYCD
jgi:hypothetical protein